MKILLKGGDKVKMNKKLLGFALAFIFLAMLATPLVACASAKPVVWSVEFSFSTLPDLITGDSSKLKMVETKPGVVKVDYIPTFGDDLVLVYNDGVDDHTLTGVVTQMVITSTLFTNEDPPRARGTEKWVFTFDDAETSTLEISANFWMDNMYAAEPNGGGTLVGTYGTGVFEGAKFKGTFDTLMALGPSGILKTQSGSGEIMFP
jgi:hypothetical protein